MSEQLDYVNNQIDKARVAKLNRFLSGNHKSIEEVRYDVGYLKALEDVEGFQKDYLKAKNPPREYEADPLEAV
jgi:YesN/AraC family two-component response regulator